MNPKIAIITGASSGIGHSFASKISQYEPLDELWLIARNQERLEELAKNISIPCRILALDLTLEVSLLKIKNILEESQPIVKVLLNASGYGKFESVEHMSLTDVVGMIDLNCKALSYLVRVSLPYMKEGSIVVNISSVAGLVPIPYGAIYSATKSFVLSFTRALNQELKKKKIKALAVCPYWTMTEFLNRANDQNVIKKFDCKYETEFIVKKIYWAMKKKKDYTVPGFIAKTTHILTKILPHRLVMWVFIHHQGLHKK